MNICRFNLQLINLILRDNETEQERKRKHTKALQT